MARKPPSPTDAGLLAAAAERGATASPSQLERWRSAGLLPRNVIERQGPGRGTTSVAPSEAVELIVWLSANGRRGQRPYDLALEAFGAGLPVPEATVRAAWRDAVYRGTELTGERDSPPPVDGQDRSEWAAEIAERAAATADPVLIPRRIRTIDRRITEAGVSWSPPELEKLDRGPTSPEPVTPRDAAVFAATTVLNGATEASGPMIAPHFRAMLPSGVGSPFASWLEYPEGPYPDAAEMVTEDGERLIPVGDVRDDLARLIAECGLDRLRGAWEAAGEMRDWALDHCAAVEAELDSGALGDATLAWMVGTVTGFYRLFVTMVLRDPQPSTHARAGTAVTLLALTDAIRRMPNFIPDGQFEVLPTVLPPFLHNLAGIVQQTDQ